MSIVRLHRLSELQHYNLNAADGEVGVLKEVYFDDSTWTVRYYVVKPGDWFNRERLLISTVAVGEIDEVNGEIAVELPRDQIKGSPPLDSGSPISRQYEADYFRYYGWPPYWESLPILPSATNPEDAVFPGTQPQRREDSRLRSSREVLGYHILAEDGEIGHVADFIIDENTSKLCYLEVDTRDWWPGKHILLNPAWITRISWSDRNVEVDLRRDDIRTAPEYAPNSIIGRDYEIKLFEHYARRKCWE